MSISSIEGKSDQELCKLLMEGERSQVSKALEVIYIRHYPSVEKYIFQKGGSENEAKDIYQEGMTAFYLQVKKGNFRQESNIKTYLIGICKRLWFKELKKRKPRVELAEHMFTPEENSLNIENEKPSDLTYEVFQVFKQISEDCQKVLELYYFERLSMQAIAEEFNFSGVQSAKNKKMKCLKYLRQKIKNSLSLD